MQRDSKFMHDIDNGQTHGKKDGGNMCLTICPTRSVLEKVFES